MSMQNVEDFYPLSPLQQGMLFHSLYAPESGVYFLQLSCTAHGDLDVAAFKRVWQQAVERHPVLRTAFLWEGLKEPVQVVHRRVRLPWEQHDWRGLALTEQDERLEVFLRADRARGFALSQAPLMRLTLIQVAEDSYHFVWSHHHLLLDGWSVSLLLKEVFVLYEAFCRGQVLPLDSPRPYRDYIAWLRQQDLTQAEAFWQQALKGVTAPTPLGVDRASDGLSGQDEDYATQQVRLSQAVTAALQSLARQQQLTLNTLVQGAWALLLSRYSGEDDVVFGVVVSGRPTALVGAESMLGLFINTLPVRVQVSPAASLLGWLKALQDRQVEARQYEYSPLVQVQGWSEVPRGLPLFESILVFENYPLDASLRMRGVRTQLRHIRLMDRTNYPLTIMAVPGAELLLRIGYDCRRFDAGTITRLLGHFQTVLEGMVAHPERRLAEVSLLTEAERQQVLVAWNATQAAAPPAQCLHTLFEARVTQTPDAVAVVCEDHQLTYRELNARANQLAHRLRTLGVGPEVLVGLYMERSLELIIGLLGILKAGGAYVPLDPAYPPERLAFMLADTQAPVLVTQQRMLAGLSAEQGWRDQGGEARSALCNARCQVLCLDTDWETIAQESQENPAVEIPAEALAYVIYTSGSTGSPKGVLVSHYNVVRLFAATQSWYHFDAHDVWSLFHSSAFDFSVWELWGALLYGGRLIVVPYWISRSPDAFYDLLSRERVTVLNQTPSAFRQLWRAAESAAARDTALRLVIFGGEALELQSLKPWFARHGDRRPQLVNMYGITETTVHVTYRRLTAADADAAAGSVIGGAIPDLQMYILDPHLQPMPIGVPGEIYVGGAGLARGYLHRPELTAERFIPHPFSNEPGARLYKTGDLARYLPDGEIEYLGRIDQQVKLRGFRIELGEIEAALAQHAAVAEAVVVAREDLPNDKRLVAYLVANQESGPPMSDLRHFLQAKLPAYMIPAAFVLLEALPLTPNGKVDRRALPAPDPARPELEGTFIAPRTPTEEVVAGLWAEVLGLERVGVHDNFFELGGHSLLATQLLARLRATFAVELPLRRLFEAPTVATVAASLEAARQSAPARPAPPLRPVARDGTLPLSFAQERLWFLAQLEPTRPFNLPVAVRLRGPLNVAALAQSLSAIVQRHEVLRTTFATTEGHPVQVIAPPRPLALPVVDLRQLPAPEREAEVRRRATAEAQQPFALAQGPLVRVTLLWLGEAEHVVLLTLHHIVTDGWSLGVLAQELLALYPACVAGQPAPLPALPIQYADFAVWQRQWLQGEVLEEQLAYWRQQLANLPVLDLPTDRPRSAVRTFRGATQAFGLSRELSAALHALSRREGVTLFMTLLAAFQTVLFRYTGQEDVVVGAPVANRTCPETEGLIGLFINDLVLRTDLSGDPSFRELLGRVREVCLGAYAHQDVPFSKLLQALQVRRDLSRPLLYQVLFVFMNVPMSAPERSDLTVSPLEVDSGTAMLDVTLSMWEGTEGLSGAFEYNTDLFNAATITRMQEYFQTVLEAIVANPAQCLSMLPPFPGQALSPVATPKAPVEDFESMHERSNLTQYQLLFWVGQKLQPDVPLYNMAHTFTIAGDIDPAHFQKAFQTLVNASDALRTVVREIDGVPHQRVIANFPCEMAYLDFSHIPEPQAAFQTWVRERCQIPFNFAERLFDSVLIKISQETFVWYLCKHHIIDDAWSTALIFRSMSDFYALSLQGQLAETVNLPPFQAYLDYERAYRRSPRYRQAQEYWQQKLAEDVELLAFYGKTPRKRTTHAHRVSCDLGGERTQGLKALAANKDLFLISLDVSLSHIFTALLCSYLWRISGNRRLSLAVPFHNRHSEAFKATIGLLMEMCPLRITIDEDDTFLSLIKKVARETLVALQHRQYATGNPLHNQAYDVMLSYDTSSFLNFNGAPVQTASVHAGHENDSLAVQVHDFELSGSFVLDFDFHGDVFTADQRGQAIQHFLQLLEAFLADPAQPLQRVNLLTAEEAHRLLVEFNQTAAAFPEEHTVAQLFDAQAQQTPDRVAVVWAGQALTYAQLRAKANQVAQHLRAQGVGPEVLVALLARRSIALLTAILAVFKAGGAYLPLDPFDPAARLCQVLRQSKSTLVLTTNDLLDTISPVVESMPVKERPLVMTIEACLQREYTEESGPTLCAPSHLAYVIYTSGSTGVPKGAMVEQRGMLNHLYAKVRDLQLTDADIVVQTASQCFDISVWQFLAALLVGGQVHIVDEEVAHDPVRLLELIARDGVTVLETVPTMLRALLEEIAISRTARHDLSALRWLILTGEALPPELCQRWLSYYPTIPMVNAYGPTECSDDVTHHFISQPLAAEVMHMPIGRPIANLQLYVLDQQLQPVPMGVAGELCVGGIGVGRGYLHEVARTAEVFVPDPFAQEPGARLYKTGDLARYLPDGTIEFLGRIDEQVKLRGYRIELGEIEAVLGQHPAVRETVVIAREDVPGRKYLVAYVVPNGEHAPMSSELHNFLKEKLPEYMVPAAFVLLEAVPLTPNGKIDRHSLPAPEQGRPELAVAFVAPRTQAEEVLARIWAAVLGVERVGMYDNFFELGGDSILGLQIIALASQAGLRLTPMQLFQHQTIAELAGAVDTAPVIQAEQGLVMGPLPLTPIQHWFFEQPLPDPHHFNQAMLLEVRQAFDPSVLERVVQHLLVHHDALRLRFAQEGSDWQQVNAGPGEAVPFTRVDLSAVSEAEQGPAMEVAAAELQASLDLSQGPLVRVALFDLGAQKPGRLLMVIHHLAVDSVSWRIVLEDLYTGYQQLSRGEAMRFLPKTTSFKRWAERLTEYVQSGAVQEELDYWLAAPRTQVSRLLVDYPGGANTVASARTVSVVLSVDETRALLQEVPAAYRTQINDVLLTALVRAFARWTGARSLLVDLEGHGREPLFDDVDLSRTVGWFTTLFPVLLDLAEASDAREALQSVREQLRGIPHRGIGYGMLRYLSEDTEIVEKMRALPQAEVSFNYLGQLDQVLPESALFGSVRESWGLFQSQQGSRSYLLDVNGFVAGGQLQLVWTYSENLHRRSTIESLAQSFMEELRLLIPLFETPPVAGVAEAIDGIAGAAVLPKRTPSLDLHAEAVLDESIYPEVVPVEPVVSPKCIFLTGATGFLGAFLLHELLQQTQAEVFCLVRSRSQEEGKKKLQSALASYELWDEARETRIIPVTGDLSRPLFGLSSDEFRLLANKIDAIYHSGAWVNFVYPYSVLKATNVLGTQEVLRLASQSKVKPVHYISTLSVFSATGDLARKVVREDDRLDHSDRLPGGYEQSKWVAEKLVTLARSRGLPVTIYRPGRITGDSCTGVWNTKDFTSTMIKSCILIGSAPVLDMMVDMTPVDFVSRAIVHLSLQGKAIGQVFHLVNPAPTHGSQLLDWICSFGYPLRRIGYEEWRASLINLTENSSITALFPLLSLFPERMLEEMPSMPVFECQNTLDGLADSAIVCAPIDAKLLHTYLSYFVRSGFLPPPPLVGHVEAVQNQIHQPPS
jgi:amino acid adenylation domain-containing protein/thioester reductase-like protein/non-ribosomal peptide synthase protein (TIGR01720 family)